MTDKTKIETIDISVRYDDAEKPWAVGELKVNGEVLTNSTAPSWHGVLDDLDEALHAAVWCEGAWLK